MSNKVVRFIGYLSLIFCRSNVEGHQNELGPQNHESWIQWIGNFHPILLHFPIALIIMTVIAELCHLFKPSPLFQNAARFMIFSAAITALPTSLLGLAYAQHSTYEGNMFLILWWHRFSGLSTAFLSIVVCLLKELQIRKKTSTKIYFIFLIGLVALVTVTGYLGGEMTFGINHLFP